MRHTGFTLLALLAAPALAGPPAVCWPVEIGQHRSLPWGKAAFTGDKAYDKSNVLKDTLALLKPETPVLVRMETLRRAVIYIDRSPEKRDRLLKALMARVLDAEARGQPDALAWFDAGYAVGCFRQMSMTQRQGYPWVKKALALGGGDPSMEFAAALLTLMGNHPAHKEYMGHVARAAKGNDTLLKRNLETLAKLSKPVLRYFEKRKQQGQK